MRIGIIGGADIAFKRFLPALKKMENSEYIGVASRAMERAEKISDSYGGKIYSSYDELIADSSIDAIYLPLPPSLHAEWGEKVLCAGKHLIMEKPFSTSLAETEGLVSLAREKSLAVHENFMFLYHAQIQKVKDIIYSGELGDIRLIRIDFGFPRRALDNFRHKKSLGGGALLDCGCYPIRLASELLGETARVKIAQLNTPSDFEVELYGSATMENDKGIIAQIAFGMDQSFRDVLEVWGSKSALRMSPVFTVMPNAKPNIAVANTQIELPCEDTFLNSLKHFALAVNDSDVREMCYQSILCQSRILQSVFDIAGK